MDIFSMFDRICASNVVIASQQRDEPDFTREQKHAILQRLYTEHPARFIYRFGSLLTDEDLTCHFDPNADYIRQIATPYRHKIRANRRFVYMQKLLNDGFYFSEEEMKQRSPLLYEQMIGKYSQNTNRNNPPIARTANGVLADFFMEHLESIDYHDRLEKEMQNEDRLRQEEEDSESDDEDEDESKYANTELELYRQEFLAIQKEKFLNGEDPNIDYVSIDNNADLDDVLIRGRDEEEKYFDNESPQTCNDNDER